VICCAVLGADSAGFATSVLDSVESPAVSV
jgi:hypothetical protein